MGRDTWLPSWTEAASLEEGGRDPLGLARVHDRLTAWLVPGITTQTTRARYYSFYLWAIGDTTRRDAPADNRAFDDGMRRREAAFVLACLAHHEGQNPGGLVGVREGQKIWNRDHASRWLSTDFRPLPSNPAGGYGQYYRGSLYELGLTETPEEARGADTLTPLGQEIAGAFEEATDASRYIGRDRRGEPKLPLDVLRAFGDVACLCQLPRARHSERSVLLSLFLGRDKHSRLAGLRPETLFFCLDAARCAEEREAAVGGEFDRFLIDEVAYYRQFWCDDEVLSYKPPPMLEDCVERWRWFALHRYLSWALEHILAALLEELRDARSGMSVGEFVESLDWGKIETLLADWARRPKGRKLADWVASVVGPAQAIDEDTSRRFDHDMRLDAPLNERDLADDLGEASDTATRVGLSLLLLIVLHCRFHHLRGSHITWQDIVRSHARDDLWFEVLAQRLDGHLGSQSSVGEFLQDLIRCEIVSRHDVAAFQRGQLRTGWFEHAQESLVWARDYAPVWRSSKIENCQSILTDLNLLAAGDEGMVTVTREGGRRLDQLLAG